MWGRFRNSFSFRLQNCAPFHSPPLPRPGSLEQVKSIGSKWLELRATSSQPIASMAIYDQRKAQIAYFPTCLLHAFADVHEHLITGLEAEQTRAGVLNIEDDKNDNDRDDHETQYV